MSKAQRGYNFGAAIRAARLGWHPLPSPAEGLMRMSGAVPAGILCELHPLGLVPNDRTPEREHYVWWEKDGGKTAISLSPFLRGLRKVKARITVLLDEQGEVSE